MTISNHHKPIDTNKDNSAELFKNEEGSTDLDQFLKDAKLLGITRENATIIFEEADGFGDGENDGFLDEDELKDAKRLIRLEEARIDVHVAVRADSSSDNNRTHFDTASPEAAEFLTGDIDGKMHPDVVEQMIQKGYFEVSQEEGPEGESIDVLQLTDKGRLLKDDILAKGELSDKHMLHHMNSFEGRDRQGNSANPAFTSATDAAKQLIGYGPGGTPMNGPEIQDLIDLGVLSVDDEGELSVTDVGARDSVLSPLSDEAAAFIDGTFDGVASIDDVEQMAFNGYLAYDADSNEYILTPRGENLQAHAEENDGVENASLQDHIDSYEAEETSDFLGDDPSDDTLDMLEEEGFIEQNEDGEYRLTNKGVSLSQFSNSYNQTAEPGTDEYYTEVVEAYETNELETMDDRDPGSDEGDIKTLDGVDVDEGARDMLLDHYDGLSSDMGHVNHLVEQGLLAYDDEEKTLTTTEKGQEMLDWTEDNGLTGVTSPSHGASLLMIDEEYNPEALQEHLDNDLLRVENGVLIMTPEGYDHLVDEGIATQEDVDTMR